MCVINLLSDLTRKNTFSFGSQVRLRLSGLSSDARIPVTAEGMGQRLIIGPKAKHVLLWRLGQKGRAFF